MKLDFLALKLISLLLFFEIVKKENDNEKYYINKIQQTNKPYIIYI